MDKDKLVEPHWYDRDRRTVAEITADAIAKLKADVAALRSHAPK